MQKKQLIWKLLVLVTIIGLLSVAGAMAADEQTVSGTIEKGDAGIVITADDGMTYAVQGKDLSAMVGKSVKATGTLAESESGKTITVVKVVEIKKMKE
jgi:Protein of unknown function (DUF5818)